VTIDELPDDVLVEIFLYVNIRDLDIPNPWHALVHVCRRWRYLVFASPRHLNLRLEYRGHRPMSEVLDAWPVPPVSLISIIRPSDQRWDNIVAALESEHSNRICEIYVNNTTNLRWERFAAAMQKPLPELILLQVYTAGHSVAPVLPESFLGGSAPRLRTLYLDMIPFPSIPKLLLSVIGLVTLFLDDIPHSGYFSTDAIAIALAVMTRLESLRLGFRFPQSRPDTESRALPPPTRSVLPSLTQLRFEGVFKYLEDLLARIDAPLLYDLYIESFTDLNFDVPQLRQFIGHAKEFKTFDRADVTLYNFGIGLCVYPNTMGIGDHRRLELQIESIELDDQLSSLFQVCNSFLPLISAFEELGIREDEDEDWFSLSGWRDDTETTQWLELLDPFTALKKLYLSVGIAQHFCDALQELSGERTTEVLPALRNLIVQGSSLEPVQEAMKTFVTTARQLSGHPVVVDRWKD
jgi:F-box-like